VSKPINIRWLIAHEPKHLFLRTAEAFAREIAASSDGRLTVEIVSMEDLGPQPTVIAEYQGQTYETTPHCLTHLDQGRVEMTQTQVYHYAMYNENFRVLDMPFLFRDHDHASRVLEGDIGRALLGSLPRHGNLKGLAFTYSGGYRVIGTDQPISSLDDFNGLRIRTNANPVNTDTMTALGAEAVALQGYGYDEIRAGELDAADTTYLRFQGSHILKTYHSLFLTAIAMRDDFLQSLPADLQQLVQDAAFRAARIERQWSLEDTDRFEQEADANGVTITELTAQDTEQMQQRLGTVYNTWRERFMPGLVDRILAH
jgi:C4-dicarboxylate-binding protein DctP